MTEVLQEYADSRGVTLRVDRAGGVLRGVKLIGMESLNGRRYRAEALAAAVSLYEGAKVNVNHPKEGPLAPRDYRDRLGVIRQVEFRPGEGLFGNLHFNPKHALAEQLAWDAENNPRNVGFSHNVLARLSREGEQTLVEAIMHVQSVDLVADPAATQGLFEEHVDEPLRGSNSGLGEAGPHNPTLGETGPHRSSLGEASPHREAIERVQAELQEGLAREAALKRQLKIRDSLDAHGIVASDGRSIVETIGAAFYQALLTADGDQRVDAMIAERADALQTLAEVKARPVADRRPRSREPMLSQRQAEAIESGKDFARAIRQRAS
jgi:hypothetical protein